jgi:uncharacterized membrane protein
MSEMDTVLLLGASYDTREAAEADDEAIKALYEEVEVTRAFDAAVLERDDEGNVHVVKKHEEPTRHGAAKGLGWGLAIGAAIAIFPAIGLAGGLVARGGAIKAVNRYVSAAVDASADELADQRKAAEASES